ncbi:MAG: enoyl-CoA hydratase-related protein, partial [bacterium]
AHRPNEDGLYIDLFNSMVDAILNCKKPVICRVNGLRVAGGQEIGMSCDLSISADTALFGQAGPRHGSSPDGGATDFLPWMLPLEQAMWNCISCELWSAYKMFRYGLISKVLPVLKWGGKFIRNPLVITDRYVDDGEIVYGEPVKGEDVQKANEIVKNAIYDFSLLDQEIDKVIWTFANLFPGCLMKAIDGIRQKKKFWWDQNKLPNRHWLAANMMGEAFLGFNAFNTRKITGKDNIDFLAYRRLLAEGHPFDETLIDKVFPPLKKEC